MVRTGELSLALLLACSALAVAYGCSVDKVECRESNQCIWARSRCDGVKDCSAGSDEDDYTCDGFPTVALPVSASVKANVGYSFEHSSVEVHLCGARHCSVVRLDGETGDKGGTLRYNAFTGCDVLGRGDCQLVPSSDGSYTTFVPGEVVLEVHHRPGLLAVWREQQPEDVVEVPVDLEEVYTKLRIRPNSYATDMPVEFTDLSEPTTTEEPVTTEAATTKESVTTEATTTEEPVTTEAATTAEPVTTEAAPSTTEEPSSPSSSSAETTATEPASSTTAPWPPVPAPASCTPDILSLLIPVEGACNKFLFCYSGRSRVMVCPSALEFNYQLQTCDWPSDVACSP